MNTRIPTFSRFAAGCRAAALALALAGFAGHAVAQNSPPVYQGSLRASNLPANGTYDIRFSLHTSASGGSTLQSADVLGVNVVDGLFSTTLPFDPALYGASAGRWIGIAVRASGSGSFTDLLPRQPLSPAPVALTLTGVSRAIPPISDQTVAPEATAPGASLVPQRWQSFTSGQAGLLRQVSARLSSTSGFERSVSASIFAGEGTAGTPLAVTSINIAADSPDGFYLFTFPQAVPVAPGQKFTVALSSISSLVSWGISASDVYAGGRSSVSPTQDFGLRTTVELPNTPPAYTFLSTVSAPSAELGAYQGGTGASAVETFNKQLVLAGPFNTSFNSGSSVKLLISDYDNDIGGDVYPIYVEDENNIVDFFIRKVAANPPVPATAYFGGNLGLGTLVPTARLDLSSASVPAGTWQCLIRNGATANVAGIRLSNSGFMELSNVAQNGAAAVVARLDSTGAWTVASDERLKHGITLARTAELLDAALKLQPVTYFYNAEKPGGPAPAQPHVGLIAQQVRDIVPNLVCESDGTLTLNYSGLSVLALGAVQEHHTLLSRASARADALADEVAALRAENDELRSALRQIERRLSGLESRPAGR